MTSLYQPITQSSHSLPAPKQEYTEALKSHTHRIHFYETGTVASGITFLVLMLLSVACLSFCVWTCGAGALLIGLGFYAVSEADCYLTDMYLARKTANEFFGQETPSEDCLKYLSTHCSAMRHLLSLGNNVQLDKLEGRQLSPCVQALMDEYEAEALPLQPGPFANPALPSAPTVA